MSGLILLLKGIFQHLLVLLAKLTALMGKLTVPMAKILVKLSLFFVAIKFSRFVETVATKLATKLAQQLTDNNPKLQQATVEMSESLGIALRTDYFVVQAVVISCIILVIASIFFPLTYKALSKPRLRIFISFNRTRETICQQLEKCLKKEGIISDHIPYQEGASHQNIVIAITEGIKKCDCFICLPGFTQSYVEHEVLAAATSLKPIIFVVSEFGGTLPNTADKRYPVFRLESSMAWGFKPVIEFLSYVGADLNSTWNLCKKVLRHPFMNTSVGVVYKVVSICMLLLWAYCYSRAIFSGHNLTTKVPSFAVIEGAVVLAHAAVLIVVASIAFVCLLSVILFLANLVWQFQARQRVRLKTVAAQFDRDDWIGVTPDLSRGGDMYRCLFKTAPSAHHEIRGK